MSDVTYLLPQPFAIIDHWEWISAINNEESILKLINLAPIGILSASIGEIIIIIFPLESILILNLRVKDYAP